VTRVASPLLQSVEGIRVGDGDAHGTVGRSGPRATSQEMVDGVAVWRQQRVHAVGRRCGG
jgi:hypothetical protein